MAGSRREEQDGIPADATTPDTSETRSTWPTGNTAINLLLADLALQIGSGLLQRGVDRAFHAGQGPAAALVRPGRLARSVGRTTLVTIGKKVVLPAIAIVGVALVLKHLADRHKAAKAADEAPPQA